FSTGLSAQSETISVQISSSTDDAEERGANANSSPGLMDLSSSDLELVIDGNDGNQFVGMRFTNIMIPQNALILNAYIQFTVDEDDDIPGTKYIQVEDSDNPGTFLGTDFNISSRTLLSDSVEWANVPVWAVVGEAGEDQRTPDLSVLVQQTVNRAGWSEGNAISFVVTGDGERVAESYDGGAGSNRQPLLVVEYVPLVTETYELGSGDDDTESNLVAGGLSFTSSDLELTSDGGVPQAVAVRWPNVTIPANALVANAYIQFTVDESDSGGDVDVIMAFEDALDAAPISGATDPTLRSYGDLFIWNNLPDWPTVDEAGPAQQTPDLSDLIQAVVDQDGWVAGNAVLAIMLDPFILSVPGYAGNTSTRVARSYNNDPAKAAKLVVSYYPPAAFQNGVFPVAAGSSWKYNDSGTDLTAENWTALNYNDTTWAFGDAILGYGNGNETTTLDFGPDAANKYPTYYLRHTFNVDDASIIDSLVFDVLRDDGVVVYVNGTEAFRMNMPTGAIDYNTLASAAVGGSNETTYFQVMTENLLVDGLNVIAVELHQASAGSSDLSFDMSVDFTLPPLTPAAYPFPAKSAWHYLDDGSNLDNIAWQDTAYADEDDFWAQGPGILGYGDPVDTEISFGPDPSNKYITYYFRREIDIDLATFPDSIQLGLLRDDGAIVYINGEEVRRDNLPEGDIDYLTTAVNTIAGSNEDIYFTSILYKTDFRDGINTIAVQVHNRDVFSSDLAFDLFLDEAPVPNPPALGCENGNQDHIACFTSIIPTEQTSNIIIPDDTHRFQAIFKQGDTYTIGGGTVPGNHDFTGYVGLNGSSEVGYLSVNHENTPGGVSMIGLHYDQSTNLWVVDSTQAVDFYNDDLVTTTRNCSGGITPWGTILTAEETQNSGDVNNDGYQDVGWLVEIDPVTARVREYGNGIQEKLWAAGRISHENAVVLNDEVTLYQGEDGGSSAVFKFIADNPQDLSSGTLYALQLDQPLAGGEPTGTTGTWIQIPNTTQADR
ncbi:MAG: alkaline phosphatase PhoX, partial [Bacteroidota bacterium]